MDMEKISVYMPGLETEGSKLAAQQAMHSQYVLQLLQLQRHAGFLCDITVNIQDKSFKAHKPLLAACSLYFRALFADGEKAKPSTLNFDEKLLSAGGFKVLLDYIYSGSLAITSENSDQVLHAANCLQMTNVVETCLNFIRSSFKATTSDVNTLDSIFPMDKEMQSTIQATKYPLGTPTISAVHQNLQESQQFHHTEVPGHQALPPVQQSPQIPQGSPGHLSQIQLYEHHARMRSAYENASQSHIAAKATAIQTQAPEVKENAAINLPASHLPIATPTSETLTMLMPYLVAKNARRPTLNEVRQLLQSGQRHGSLPVESPERYPLKQPPPALISANDAYLERNDAGFDEMTSVLQQPAGTFSPEKQSPLNMTTPRSSVGEVISLDGNPHYNANNIVNSLHGSEENSTTSRTTVHADHTFDVKSAQLSAKELQPFVLMTPGNNAHIPRASRSSDDGSKGCAWSDDRSVGSNQTGDQNATHLSGTPCTAGLTLGSITSDECRQQRLFQATSPASFGSAPSIEISPVSVTTSESPTMDSQMAPKTRCTRAQSLDFSNIPINTKPANQSITRSIVDFRSSSLSPGFFSDKSSSNCVTFKNQVPGDHSSLISAEQAASAVGALFVGAKMEQQKRMPERHSSADDSCSTHDYSRLVIDEHPDISDHLPDTDAESRGSSGLPKSENHYTFPATYHNSENYDNLTESQDVPTVNDAQNPQNEDRVVVKTEPEHRSRMSPPLDQSFSPSGQEDNLSRSTSSSHECSVDENGVLDLSMQKPSATPVLQVTSVFSRNSLHHQGQDQKAQDALDALVMMQNTAKPLDAMPPQVIPASTNLALEDNSMAMTLGFSRKPRRSSGGQTCQWPGCGRLFRHRNIYEEHKKLHEMGVPVHQLRKCYMGARVKKTARERLEEMRMVEGSGGSQVTDGLDPDPNISNYQLPNNRRKRGANSHKEGPDRKRVTAKDRNDIARNLPWQPPQSSLATIQHGPLFSHAPSIPLAVLQAVSSGSSLRQPWQAGQPAGGVPLNVLSYPSGPSGPIATSDRTQAAHHQSLATHNNAAVVETLAALGIPIPAKRDGEDHAARLGMPNVMMMMQSPTKAMTMDQLRRSIALRETTVSGTTSSGIKAAVNLQPPIQQAQSSQQGIGKVTGNSIIADATPIPRSMGGWVSNHVSSGIEMPAPNNNHVNHGEKCS